MLMGDRLRLGTLLVLVLPGVWSLAIAAGQQEVQDANPPESSASDPTVVVAWSPGPTSVAEQESRLLPLEPGTHFQRFRAGQGLVEGTATDGSGRLVYSNRLGSSVYSPGGTLGLLIADDIATASFPGCVLDRLVFRVCGDPVGNGSGVGPFSVTFALYSGCPSLGAEPLFEPITQEFPDNGDYEVIFKPSTKTEIEVPLYAFFGVSFSRYLAGIVIGAPPTLGYSADRFDFPLTNCSAGLGGYPAFNHASFDLEIYARDDCAGGNCSPTCVDGANHGELCVRDDCPGGTCVPDIACLGGVDHGQDCTVDDDCANKCIGGPNDLGDCAVQEDCPRECVGGANAGNTCVDSSECPDGFCSGFCLISVCAGDQCVGGTNDGVECETDDCPGGSCSGPKQCDGGENDGLFCDYACLPAFPAYLNAEPGGGGYTSQPLNDFFAEDIRLAVPVDESNPCELVSFDVGFIGFGAVQATLHTFLDPSDPENGGMIPDTRMVSYVGSQTSTVLRKTFDPPIPITTQDLFMVFRTDSGLVGVDRNCGWWARLGETQSLFFVYSKAIGQWIAAGFGQDCFLGGFELAINCAGSPPAGACCDMKFTENNTCVGGPLDGSPCTAGSQCRVCIGGDRDGFSCTHNVNCPGGGKCPDQFGIVCVGDAVCRELPEMNCAWPYLWQEGAACKSTCVGGDNDGEVCTRQADCPGGECPGPFAHPCGTGRCCTPQDTCEDLTEAECVALAPPGDEVLWSKGTTTIFCEDPVAPCSFHACRQQRGDCAIARTDPGCESSLCCHDVCEIDESCCLVEWDEICVREAQDVQNYCGAKPGNDVCWDADPDGGALPLDMDGTPAIGMFGEYMDEPPICCRLDEAEEPTRGAIWYTFEATETSARIHTCNTTLPVDDTLIQVFRVVDPSTPETACNSLDRIACNDGAPGCGTGSLAELCVTGLTPGETYYVMVAQNLHFEEDVGVYTLELEAPCTPLVELPSNDDCLGASLITEDATPFDLNGSTFDCPGPPSSCLVTMENDLWYDWIAPGTGRLTVETCDPDPAEPDQTPETSLVVYDGCDCPVEMGSELVCSGTLIHIDGCLLGASVDAPVKAGACYKIRLGGNLGGTPSGTLTTDFTGCPSAPAKLIDPPEGTVDARQPHPPGNPDAEMGIDSIVVSWPGGTTDIFCSSYCETPLEGFAANSFITRVNNLDDTFTFRLARPLAPGAVGTLTFLHADGPSSTLTITSHPGNVDATSPTEMPDLNALVGALNGTTPFNKYSHDIDHSGALTSHDALRLIDLLTGAGGAFEPWLGTKLPVCTTCCPQ